MSQITIRAENFRVLERLDWSPSGVCLLAGANGVGKTSVCKVLEFLQNLYRRSMTNAIFNVGGPSLLRNRAAPQDAMVKVELEVGDVRWSIEIPVEGRGVAVYYGERLWHAGAEVLHAHALQSEYDLPIRKNEEKPERRGRGDKTVLDTFGTRDEPAWLKPLDEFLMNFRFYSVYNLIEVSRPHPADEQDARLHPGGRNLGTVLQNWQKSPRIYGNQFRWVIDRLRIAFPDLVDDLEFEPDGSPSVFPPDSRGPHDRIPLHLMADGLITGLLHLTAVAGAPANSMLAIDEMENQLHPHAIRSILRAMRERAAERNLTIVLTTHSPVLMNEFGDCPGQIFVLDYRNGSTPTKLDEIKSAEWLSLFSLGDLYDRMKFAAPAISIGSAEEV